LRGIDRSEGARSLEAATRRLERAVRPPREHRGVLDAHGIGPHLQDEVRLRAGRPEPPRCGGAHDQDDRQRLRRLPDSPWEGEVASFISSKRISYALRDVWCCRRAFDSDPGRVTGTAGSTT